MPGPFTSPVALSVPFEPDRDPQWGGNPGPSGISSINVQDAIEEARADALANDRFLVLPSYGGNANTGRYLEVWGGQASNVSPIFFSVSARILSVTLQTTSAQSTCNLGIFDLNVSSVVPVYTIVMSNQKRVQFVGDPLATLAPNSLVAMRVTSGSINTPTLQITFSASA
jgi:hypothetical protein